MVRAFQPVRCEAGNMAIEYCLIAALIACVIIAGVAATGSGLAMQLQRFASAMAAG